MPAEPSKKIKDCVAKNWPSAELQERVGNNGLIYRDLNENIAIMFLSDKTKIDRFSREIDSMMNLRDLPQVVPLIASCVDDPQCAYFIMPWYDKGSLTARIPKISEDTSGRTAVEFTLEIAKALKSIHDRGKAHRDLKPDNILISASEEPHLADFGLCLDITEDNRITPDYRLVGAIAYRAPEFLRGRLDTSDHRKGDVFSLGRMLWALLVGKEPNNLTDYEFSIQLPSTLQPGLRRPMFLDCIVSRATELSPSLRLNIDQLIESLEEWLVDHTRGSVSAIVASLQENPVVIQRISQGNIATKTAKDAGDLLELLTNELRSLVDIAGWSAILNTAKGNTNIICGPESYSDDAKNLIWRHNENALHLQQNNEKGCSASFNLGDISLAPSISVAVALSVDLNAQENQTIEIVSIVWHRRQSSHDDIECELLHFWNCRFSYDDPSICTNSVKNLAQAFARANKVLKGELVQNDR